MRGLLGSFAFLVAATGLARADDAPPPSPGIEVVREHIDIDLKQTGSYTEVTDIAYRILDAQGLAGMRQVTLSFTDGYQSLNVVGAYTLKADGRRVGVDRDAGILYGHGATTRPGFDDVKTMTVVFPDLEVGDQVVLQTIFQQMTPWFPGQFAFGLNFDRSLAARDTRITLSAPAEGYKLWMDSAGSADSRRTTAGRQILQSWTFRNDTAQPPEDFATLDPQTRPHIAISTFSGYRAVADIYAGTLKGKSEVTPQIQALADKLTAGITNRREQARALYDWTATHISYVALVLGAGGFIPHAAQEVLNTKYGDCKDHVMLLEALLKAKGIKSSAVLINAGLLYKLPLIASPSLFNHVITYIPEFDMFVDSTAQFAPFGVLPQTDAGKPVLLVGYGVVGTTPAVMPDDNKIRVVQSVRVSEDGNAEGQSRITASGAAAIDLRALLSAMQPVNDNDYFRGMLGPGASGTIERGDLQKLTNDYTFTANYKIPGYINLPGPGALPAGMGYKPFSFTMMLGGLLAGHRTEPYACQSVGAEDDVTVALPADIEIAALPKNMDAEANGAHFTDTYEKLSGNRLHAVTQLRIEHKANICSAEDYNAAHAATMKIISRLKSQVLYK